jgi:hypothetical protein
MENYLDAASINQEQMFVVSMFILKIIIRKYLKEINIFIDKSLRLGEYNPFQIKMKKIGVL